MPVKLGSKLPNEEPEARIEIVPLIDIMFFLLASFMLVSLSMVNLKSVKLNLPTATTATPETQKDLLDISVDKTGSVYLEKKAIGDRDLRQSLIERQRADPKLRVFISGDREARHGDVMHVLDVVRSAGIDKVAFEISSSTESQSSHFKSQISDFKSQISDFKSQISDISDFKSQTLNAQINAEQ